jgi:acetyl esterase
MPLDPPLAIIAGLLAGQPEPRSLTMAERRASVHAGMTALALPRPAQLTVSEHSVPVAGGTVTVRRLRHDHASLVRPAVLFLHGGGWVHGDLDTGEVEAGPLGAGTGADLFLADYRLAPEHAFPTPLDDCVSAYEWLHRSAAELGVDPQRIVVAGASAGANLAASLCLDVRDRGLPAPVLQLLDVPLLDLTLTSPSVRELGDLPGLSQEDIRDFVGMYLAGHDPTDPRVSPLLAADLSGLPPAVITVAELDPVRDDGERYQAALHAAGVAASCIRVNSQFHGGWVIPATITAGLVNDFRAAAVRRACDSSLAPPIDLLAMAAASGQP